MDKATPGATRTPPLDPLRGFVAAARQLSFTRAADQLHLTQSAISRQVQTLEDALGVALFRRGVRALALTDEGARLALAAERWLEEYATLAAELRTPAPRPVTVTAAIGISALWLVPRLRGFQALYPDIDVRIAACNRVVDLKLEDVDLALRYCPREDVPAGADWLFGDELFPVAHPSLARTLRIDADTLPGLTLLDYDERYPWLGWDEWLAALGLAGIKPRARLRFNHYDQLIHAAAAGQGVAIGRAALVAPLLEEGRLAVVGDIRHRQGNRGIWLVAAPGTMRPEVACFAEWVRATAAADRAAGDPHPVGPASDAGP